MSKIRVNYKSDLPPISVTFKINGRIVDVPTNDFIIRFYVDGAPGTSFLCTCKNGEYTNCAKTSSTTLECYIDNHKFGCGRLCCEYIDIATDRRYADKQLKTVSPSILDVILVDGVGDDNVEVLSATFNFEPNEIVSIATQESEESGGVNTITITQGNGEVITFGVKNGKDGAKGDKGDTGVYVTDPDFSIVDDCETDSGTDGLSARQGKRLNGRLEVVEESLADTTYYTATIVNNTYIKREPSAEKGDIGQFNNLNLHIFTGLIAGREITIAFSGTDTTSGAQAAGWYPTSVVSEMSHSNFSVVSGLDTWSKNTQNNTYTVTVPVGAPTLVVSAQGNVTVSVSSTQVGARMDNLENGISDHEERIGTLEDTVAEHESELYIEESSALIVDEIAEGYRIVNTTTDVDTEGSQFFDLKSYKVNAGDEIHIANTSNTQGFTTRVYAFYSNEALTDGEGNVLVGSSTYIAIDSSYNHTWGTAVFDDTLTVPEGANLLVVTHNKSAESNPVAEVIEKVGVGTAVEEFAEKMEGFSPYKMQAKREGENIYVAYNRGDGVEMVYHFGRVFTSTNNVLGLRVVGYRNVNRPNSIASPDNIIMLCNQITSDMFSAPVSLDGVWVGGAHNIDDTPTSVNISWEVTADGNALTSGVVDCSSVTVTAVNKFTHPTWGDVLEETVVMKVYGDHLDMTVSHNYKYAGAVGRNIRTYYGMMSNAFGSQYTNLIKTEAGGHPYWTIQNAAQSFTKAQYPYYCELIARKPNGWHQSMRLDTTNYGTVDGFTYIGDHSLLRDTDNISLAYSEIGTFKLYHVLILGGATVTSGMKYMWKGTYRWWN